VTYQPDPGTTLTAVDAIRDGQELFDRAQVTYLMHLAFGSGLFYGHSFDVADMLATWAAHGIEQPSRAERIAAEVAAAGPAKFAGGLPQPPTYYPADPARVAPRFPTLDEQAIWLSADDVEFCRRYARENYGGRA
jgi:hypothetical protein